MYQAIVLLPLLGAILAGAISLYGARRRFPGAEPSRRPSRAAHGRGRTRARVTPTHHDDHDHAPGGARRRKARARPRSSPPSLLFIAMVLSWIAFWRVGFGHHDERITLFTWIISAT